MSGWMSQLGAQLGHCEAVGPGCGVISSFANVGVIAGTRHLLLVDTSLERLAPLVLNRVRQEFPLPIQAIVLTHGHVDHVGGVDHVLHDAEKRGDERPQVWAQQRILQRFQRYQRTWGWNNEVNRRQFGNATGAGKSLFPQVFPQPDVLVEESALLDLDGEPIELYHADAETDDALWLWLPQRQVAFVGDLLLRSLPNTGNPNKVQRNTLGWAEALEAVAAKHPQFLVTGHQQAIHGAADCEEMLRETARALRVLHDAVVDRLNAGRWPGEIVAEGITLPPDLQARPYLAPIYGCAEFIVRDVLRQYAGWWDGDPAQLFPVPRTTVATEIVSLMGVDTLAARVRELLAAEDFPLALELATTLHRAAPDSPSARELLAAALNGLAENATSLIARNLYQQEALRLQEIR